MSNKLASLEQEIRQLGEQLNHIENVVVNARRRLDALQAELTAERIQIEASIPTLPTTPLVEPPRTPIPSLPEPPPSSSHVSSGAASKQKNREWEALIGGNWFNKIGIAAIILGVAFFLRYAIENDWINNTGKVLLGIVTGLAFIAGGERFQNQRLKVFARGLTGGGAAILYLSLYFAFQVYQLLSQTLAFGFMALVTAGMVALALRHASRTILLFAMFGGFLTPFWLSTGAVRPVALFTYIAILDLGLVAVALRHSWRFVNSLCFLATTALYFAWYEGYYTASQFWIGEIYLTIFYLVFAALAFFINLVQRKPAQPLDALPILGSAFFFFLGNLALLGSIDAEDYHSLLCAVMALLYGGLSYVALRRVREDKLLALLLMGAATVFLTLFFPFEFNEKWLPLAWLLEGLVLLHIGLYLRLTALHGLGGAIWSLAILALAAQTMDASQATTSRHLYATFFTASAAMFLALAAQSRLTFKSEGIWFTLQRALEIITLLLLPFLLAEYRSDLALLGFAFVLFLFIKIPQLTSAASATAALYFIPLAAVLVFMNEFDPSWLAFADYRLILNPRFLFYCGIAAMLAYYLLQKEKFAPFAASPAGFELLLKGSGLAIIVVLFAALSLETMSFYQFREEQTGAELYAPKHFALSLVWSIYSLALLGLGLWKRMLAPRLAALSIFALTLLKALFVDFWLIDKLYRIISAIAFG
ncbi:MAG: DUF2339 domain-containing protein, partial [candidate division KSB1 bacterium]